MNRMLPALSLGLGLILTFLWGLGTVPSIAQARDNQNETQVTLAHYVPQPQVGTGFIRVAITGTDTAGCGDVASPCATVQFAVDEANVGDEILIAAGTYSGVQVRNGMAQTVYISKSLIVRGGYTTTDSFAASDPIANPTILDAQGSGRVMVITGSGVNATIENLTVTRGRVEGNGLCPPDCGGGIFAANALSLTNVSVISNTAERDGGGVAVILTTTLTNVRFERNMAGFNGDGGGLLVDSGPVSISGTTFISNTSSLAGGGAQVAGPTTIINSRFERNVSLFNVGGGLKTSAAPSISQTISISNTTFISNTTLCSGSLPICHGGGMYAFDVNVVLINSHFENNRCTDTGCDGGGLYLSRAFNASALTLLNTDFISNTAGRSGGGAYGTNLVSLTGGRFERNQASGSGLTFSDGGGGLYAGTLSLSGTQFISNTSLKDGGGVWAGATASLTGGRFEGNASSRHGGGLAVRAFASPLTLRDTRFISNTAQNNGGGLWIEINGATLNGGLFERNTTLSNEGDGAGLWVFHNLTLTGTQFISNTAQNNGGGAFVSSGNATLNGGHFERNQARGTDFFKDGGGGVYVNNGDLTGTGTQFVGNISQNHGGGGVVRGVTNLTNVLFQDNSVDRSGGGLFTFNTLTVASSQFISNTASDIGGGAFTTGEARLTNSLFRQNRSSGGLGQGGGLRALTMTVTSTQFISNFASFVGGGALAFGTANLSDSLFQDNISDGSGGGLSTSFNPLTLTNTRFINNTAAIRGGGIAGNSIKINLNGGLFQNNRANTNSGGGLSTSGQLILTGTQFISNSAMLDGGGAWANSGAILTNGHFERNLSSEGNGGGLAAPLGHLTLNDSDNRFVGNTAGLDGGGAFSFDATLVGGRFENNLAQSHGGGLRVRRSLILTNSAFINNNAAALGGGVVISNTSGRTNRLVNGLFARNRAGQNGASLYLDTNGSVNILHATIASPTLATGQAIYINGGVANITNTIIASHTTDIEVNPGATVNEDYNLFDDGPNFVNAGTLNTGPNSLAGNPAFLDPANDDYHLMASSVAINSGTDAGVTTDFEGDLRPGGTGFDIGYDETDFTADLSISKSSVRNQKAAAITYTIVVQNLGPNDASAAIVSDTIPAGISSFTWTCIASGGATCNVAGGTGSINEPIPGFPAGGQVVYTVRAMLPNTNTTVVNVATVTAPAGVTDPLPTINNRAIDISEPDVSGSPGGDIFLPIIFKEPVRGAPDLVVSDLIASSNGITVTIKNIGNSPVVDAFWVDVYIEPSSPPSQVNQHWFDLAGEGLVWGVTTPIAVNDVLVLTIGDQYYSAENSHFSGSLSPGTPVWVQVDSVNLNTTYGGVLESHEISGGAYNNITHTVSAASLTVALPPAAGSAPPASGGNLPPRNEN